MFSSFFFVVAVVVGSTKNKEREIDARVASFSASLFLFLLFFKFKKKYPFAWSDFQKKKHDKEAKRQVQSFLRQFFFTHFLSEPPSTKTKHREERTYQMQDAPCPLLHRSRRTPLRRRRPWWRALPSEIDTRTKKRDERLFEFFVWLCLGGVFFLFPQCQETFFQKNLYFKFSNSNKKWSSLSLSLSRSLLRRLPIPFAFFSPSLSLSFSSVGSLPLYLKFSLLPFLPSFLPPPLLLSSLFSLLHSSKALSGSSSSRGPCPRRRPRRRTSE